MNIIKVVLYCCITIFMVSCKLDNYDKPQSQLSGSIVDKETGELVEQDIIRGTQIEYKEGRFTAIQYLSVKANGTFQNNQVFSGTYSMVPVRGNFEPIDAETVDINGHTQKVFQVTPFLRIKNVSIFKNGNKVKALFKVQQTGFDNVLKVGLYAGVDKAVGANVNTAYIELPIGTKLTDDNYMSIELNLGSNPKLTTGKTYFFRVGAVIDAPEAKFNYAPALQLTL